MGQQHRVMDDLAEMIDGSVAIAAGTTGAIAAHDSVAIDLGAADVDEERAGEVVVQVPTNLTSGGSATILFALIDCDTVGGTYLVLTPVAVNTVAIDFDDVSMLNGAEPLRLPLPKYGVRQFIKLRYTIAVATVTGGTINAHFAK